MSKCKKQILAIIFILVLILQTIYPVVVNATDIYENEIQEFSYDVKEDGTVEITGYFGNKTIMQIPETIGEYTVTSIGNSIFSFCDSEIEEIIISNTIKSIGFNAFANCTKLKKVTISTSVEEIKDGAFAFCPELNEIIVETGNENYIVESGVLFNKEKTDLVCYIPKNSDTEYSVPSDIIRIKDNAFNHCNNLIKITLNEELEEIGNLVFYSCEKLEELNLPKNLINIGYNAFVMCDELQKITVDEENVNYKVIDEVLYGYDCLIYYPSKKENEIYDIPKGTYGIEDYAFSNNSNLKSVTMPDTIEYIGAYVFYECSNLETVKLSNKMNTINEYDFYNCPKLKDICIPKSVIYIYINTFNNCENLNQVIIPKNVRNIGYNSFENCGELKIICATDSVAHNYATEKNIEVILDDEAPTAEIYKDPEIKDINIEECDKINNNLDFIVSEINDDISGVDESKVECQIEIEKNGYKNTYYSGQVNKNSNGEWVKTLYLKRDSQTEIDEKNSIVIQEIDGKYIYGIMVEDLVGNRNVSYLDEFMVDLHAPSIYGQISYDYKTRIIEVENEEENVNANEISDEITNEQVETILEKYCIVTIRVNEEIKEVEGWTLSEDKKVLTKEYVENSIDEFNIQDLVGNTTLVKVEVDQLMDDIAPEYNINVYESTNTGEWIKLDDTYVTISNETKNGKPGDKGEEESYTKLVVNKATNKNIKIEIQANEQLKEVDGWILSNDRKKLSMEIEENVEIPMQITIEDLSGNSGKMLEYQVIGIDKIAPQIEINYNHNNEENYTTVELISNKKIKEIKGWTLSEDKKTLTKDYNINTVENVIVKDLVENETTVEISIRNIPDNEKPEAVVNYYKLEESDKWIKLEDGDKTNTIVKVEILANEQLITEKEQVERAIDVIDNNISYKNTRVEDVELQMQNATSDDEYQRLQEEWQVLQDELKLLQEQKEKLENKLQQLQKLENDGWIMSEDRMSLSKVFSDNVGKQTITIADLAGNENSDIQFIVDQIDRDLPNIAIHYYTKNEDGSWRDLGLSIPIGVALTNNTVKVEIKGTNEKIVVKSMYQNEEWETLDDGYTWQREYEKNIDEDIEIKDLAGNTIRERVQVSIIDKSKPIIEKNEDIYINKDNQLINVRINKYNEYGPKAEIDENKIYYLMTEKEIQPNDKEIEKKENKFYNREINLNNKYVDGTWYLWVKATDELGNSATELVGKVIIDTKEPNIVDVKYDYETEEGKCIISITVDEKVRSVSGWTVDTEGTKLTKIFTSNTEEVVNVYDLVGNRTQKVITVNGFEEEKIMNCNVKYYIFSETENKYVELENQKTNKNVMVQIIADREIQEKSGWDLSEDKKILTKEYESNTNEIIEVLDVQGNIKYVEININNIDKEIPVLEISYSTQDLTKESVEVTITSNKELMEVPGWVLSEDKKVLRKTYESNTNEEIKVKDLLGNEASINCIITNIDKEGPQILNVEYSTKNPTNTSVNVKIITNEKLQPVTGWQLVDNNTAIYKVYDNNINEEIVVKDILGNESEVSIVIENIDKEAPKVNNVNYSSEKLTNQNVIVQVELNEQVRQIEGWNLSIDKKVLTKVYAVNTEETIEILDLAGNSVEVDVNIANIDKELPYVVNKTESSNNNTYTVILEINEQVKDIQGWTKETSDKVIWKKEYPINENFDEQVILEDLAGNIREINIQKQTNDLKINIEYSQTNITNQDVIVTIRANKEILGIEGWNLSDDHKILQKVYKENDKETINVKDYEGNVKAAVVDISNIDKEAPITTLNYSEVELTKGPVVATIMVNEPVQEIPDWTLLEATVDNEKVYILTKAYESNVTSDILEVKDIAGNSTTLIIEIMNIDNQAPVIRSIEYSTQNPTNEDVIVTIRLNEMVQEIEGWTLADDTILTRTYDKNVDEEIVIKDILGNELKTQITINNIDKEAPKAEVLYSTKETAQEVIVTLTTNEQIHDLSGWTRTADTTWTKIYIQNAEETIALIDLVGNKTFVTVKVENIDHTAPTINVNYSTEEPTNQNVEVRLEADEKLAELGGWTLSEDKKVLSKIYEHNVANETVLVCDIAGNMTQKIININNIDKEAPIVNVNYSESSNSSCIVMLTSNEPLQEMNNWNAMNDAMAFERTFHYNIVETIKVKDLAGNEAEVEIEVLNIRDLEPPQVIRVEYSTEEATKDDVIVKITLSEQVREIEGWEQTREGEIQSYTLTKAYSENVKEKIRIQDLFGNTNTVDIVIRNIDKQPPITNTYNVLQQDGSIQVEIRAEEALQAIDGWERINDGCSLIKSYRENINEIIVVKDMVGNETQVPVIISEFRDVTPPRANISYSTQEPTKDDVEVTITVNEQIQPIEGWQLQKITEHNYTLKKTYTENITENIALKDLSGNITNQEVRITNIDKKAPTTKVIYSNENPTNQKVIVTILVDEEVRIVSENQRWTDNKNGQLTKEYEDNETEEVVIQDNAGNQTTVVINVTNIDKEAPILQVEYSQTEMTNKDVIVTITVNEEPRPIEGWELSQKQEEGKTKYVLTKTYVENVQEEVVIWDLAGNTKKQAIEINNIDKTSPDAKVEYSTTELTKEPVVVNITSNEKLQQIEGWTLSGDMKKLSKTYSINIEESIILKDLVGNETKVDISIRNIEDKTLPIIVANYSIKELTNQNVIVSLVSNKQLRKVEGWILSDDKKILTKQYENNMSETVIVSDLAGNQVSLQIQVNNIDKQSAEVEVNYSIKEMTKDNVIVTLTANEKIQALEGWETIDEYTLKKTYENNAKENIVIKDMVGNETSVTIQISNIDKQAPTINAEYSTKDLTNENVEVKIIANEKVQKVEGWSLSEDGKTLSKTYSANTEEKINVLDLVGNESTITINISNIDKVAPTIQVNYSTKEENQESVIVTIIANEKIQAIEGWTLSKDEKQMTKTYYQNKKETLKVKDLAGNVASAQIDISNIGTSQELEIEDCEIEEQYIYNLKSNCTKEELVKRIQTQLSYKIYNAKGNEIQNKELIGTGSKIVLSTGESYTFVIKADLDSDGIVGINDLLKMKRQIVGMISLENEYKKACDINSNQDVDLTDLLLMKKAVVGIISL